MAHSRLDKDEILVVHKERRQLEIEVAALEKDFVRRHPIALSEVTGEFYCWMDRREPAREAGSDQDTPESSVQH